MIDRADTPGVLAPPPLLFLAALVAGLLLDRLVWRQAIGASGWTWIVVTALLGLGGALIASAGFAFRRADTPPAPWRPTRAIAAAGPYRFTRNPMYVGMAAIYLGIAISADSLPTLALLCPLMIVVDVFVVRREERYLEEKFGAPYRNYRAGVRR